jgi:hypothetical protein
MDPTLKALIEAAERGEDVPRVQVVLGAGLVSGVPIPHAEYAELQRQSIQVDLVKGQRISTQEQEAAEKEAEQRSVGLAAFAQTKTDASALVLKEVALFLGTGETVRARTMRLPTDQIELWWAGAFEVKGGERRGGLLR